MPVSEYEQKQIDAFFAAIEPLKDAYRDDSFTYVAIRHGDAFVLIQGVVHLNVMPAVLPYTHFKSANVRAGHYRLSELKLTRTDVIDKLLSGKVETPGGPLSFPSDHGDRRNLYYAPFQPFALQNQNRINTFSITGSQQASFIQQLALDWELRAAPTPYDTLQELMFEYGLGTLKNNAIIVEFFAHSVAAVDGASRLSGETATLGLRLVPGLKTEKAALGYRVLSNGQVTERSMIEGGKLAWTAADTYQLGTTEITVPKGAVIQCIASYDGLAQNFYWVGDPTTVQNTRRTAYETYDRQLERLREILSREQYRAGQDARDFEAAIAWLLWMLGFSIVHLNTTRSSDGPDLIATVPSGNMVVVECTIGLLKAENKLPQLYERTQALRRSLDAAGKGHVRILPVMVTAKKKSDVAAELEQAERHGILVLTRESIESAIPRTLALPNAERLYEDGEQAVRTALDKYTAQGDLPLQS